MNPEPEIRLGSVLDTEGLIKTIANTVRAELAAKFSHIPIKYQDSYDPENNEIKYIFQGTKPKVRDFICNRYDKVCFLGENYDLSEEVPQKLIIVLCSDLAKLALLALHVSMHQGRRYMIIFNGFDNESAAGVIGSWLDKHRVVACIWLCAIERAELQHKSLFRALKCFAASQSELREELGGLREELGGLRKELKDFMERLEKTIKRNN